MYNTQGWKASFLVKTIAFITIFNKFQHSLVQAENVNGMELKSCETLKTKLSYKQENAPKDISAVLRVIVEKVNRELDGVLDVDVNWTGFDIQRAVGDHVIQATVTRLVSSVDYDIDAGPKKTQIDDQGREVITQCFSVEFQIRDTNECILPMGNSMRHMCEYPSVCVNTIGSYECVCPMMGNTDITLDPILEHNPKSTASENFWSQIQSTSTLRTPWDLSLPLSTSYCPSKPSTLNCCPFDAHSSFGKLCRSNFRCPSDPCVSTQMSSASKKKQKQLITSSPCDEKATCTRSNNPLTHPTFSCICPAGTIGNGQICRNGVDPVPQPKVTFDGITPTSETLQNMENFCGCTKPVVDPCAGYPPCKRKNEVCVADKQNQPSCQCKEGYVYDENFGCVDLTPPTLKLRCDPNGNGINVLQRGDIYEECAVDIVDENAEDYSRSLRIAYSRPLSPGRCLKELGFFTVNYTVATPWTNPPFVGVLRRVEVTDRNVCEIPFDDYVKWCPEILPKCDVGNGASCKAKKGGWSCQCPDGTEGDGILPAEGGSSCVDNRKPIVEILGQNPRIFKVCGCGGLSEVTPDERNMKKESREEKLQRYELDLKSIIVSSDGSKLCTATINSNTSCVNAFDERYDSIVDLSDRVKIGNPIRVDPVSESDGREFTWKIPYDVVDDAGNEAITVFREVKVIEMELKELEKNIERDLLMNREQEINEAVNRALKKEREKRTEEEARNKRRKQKVPSCPSCSPCEKCKSNVSPESCKPICENQIKSSAHQSCKAPPGNFVEFSSIVTIPRMLRETYASMADGGVSDIFFGIIFVSVVGFVILIFVWLYPSGHDLSKIDEEQERALLNAVTYHKSPPPMKTENGLMGLNKDRENLPPPRLSMPFNTTSVQDTKQSNYFSPQVQLNSNLEEDIYRQKTTPITPSLSNSKSIGDAMSSPYK